MAKGIALLQIYVCSAEGKVGKGFKALSGFRGKEYINKYKPSERIMQKIALKVAATLISSDGFPWFFQGLHTSAEGCDQFVQAQLTAGGSIQSPVWDHEILPNSFRKYQLSSAQSMPPSYPKAQAMG